MRQETEFFEKQQIEALPAKISEQFVELPNAVGEKFSVTLVFLGMMISGLTLAFIATPNFAGIVCLYFPVFIFIIAVYGKFAKGQTA